jgi:hypothetical protein
LKDFHTSNNCNYIDQGYYCISIQVANFHLVTKPDAIEPTHPCSELSHPRRLSINIRPGQQLVQHVA